MNLIACGPNLAPGRCEVPPSNGAPMIMMSVPAQDGGSDRSAAGTPRNVASGPYRFPIRVIAGLRSPTLASPQAPPAPGRASRRADSLLMQTRRAQRPGRAPRGLAAGVWRFVAGVVAGGWNGGICCRGSAPRRCGRHARADPRGRRRPRPTPRRSRHAELPRRRRVPGRRRRRDPLAQAAALRWPAPARSWRDRPASRVAPADRARLAHQRGMRPRAEPARRPRRPGRAHHAHLADRGGPRHGACRARRDLRLRHRPARCRR